MATSGEKRWPPVGNFVAASGEKPMAIDMSGPLGWRVLRGRPAGGGRKPPQGASVKSRGAERCGKGAP